MGFLVIFLLFVVCVGGCYYVFTAVGEIIFPEKKDRYVDKTTHIHHYYYDNRSVHVDNETFKGLKK